MYYYYGMLRSAGSSIPYVWLGTNGLLVPNITNVYTVYYTMCYAVCVYARWNFKNLSLSLSLKGSFILQTKKKKKKEVTC